MRTHVRQARTPSSDARNGPQSVGRVVSILEALSGVRDSATLSELAVEVGAPKTSLVGLLGGLTAERCLERDAAGHYRLGPRFISLAMRVASGRELIMLARPIMTDMVEATGETAVLGALAPDQDAAIYLDKVESTNPIRYAVTAGERRELYCTGIGKVLLAHMDPARLQIFLKSTARRRFTPTTITGARALRAELSGVRQEGIARTRDERIAGASGIAAPVFGSDGSVVAALLIAGPSERMQAHAERNERILRRAAAECSHLVGGVSRAEP